VLIFNDGKGSAKRYLLKDKSERKVKEGYNGKDGNACNGVRHEEHIRMPTWSLYMTIES
jgi:hypothetical protein